MMNDAIWECQLNFEEFWGQKLLNALKAMHSVLYSGEDLGEEEEDSKDDNSDDEIDTSNWIISKRQDDLREEEE